MACPAPHQPFEIPDRGPIISRRAACTVLGLAMAVLLFLTGRVSVSPGDASSELPNKHSTLSSESLIVAADNKYSLRDGKPFLDYYPWLKHSQVLEPHLESTLTILNSVVDASYDWSVGDQVFANLNVVQHTCKTPGKISVRVTERFPNSATPSRDYQSIWYCKYVRREIRSLFDEDREAFFRAAEILYKLPQSVGVPKFGSNYLSMDKLVFMHNNLAGQKDCDHAHDGNGFITIHIALSNVFERSLQTTNPRVSLPYWDYTIEGSRVYENDMDLSHWFNSEVFHDDWFGEANPPNHVVTRGRFAYTRVRTAVRDDEVHNVYGFIRAPWNANKIPYVTRCNTMVGYKFDTIPTCYEHQAIVSKNSWADFASQLALSPHGLVHALLGGQWGADWPSLFADFNYSDTYGFDVARVGFALQKQLYRSGFLVCPTSCRVDDAVDACKCTCPTLTATKHDQNMIFTLLQKAALFQHEEYFYNLNGDWVGYDILRVICNDFPGVAPVLGDQLESASPADISFWPIHPTLERLLQWKQLNGGFEDNEWAADDKACKGHNPDDEVPFIHLYDGQTDFMTNRELLEWLDARQDGLDYIYDKFEWNHCEVMGIPTRLFY